MPWVWALDAGVRVEGEWCGVSGRECYHGIKCVGMMVPNVIISHSEIILP